MLIFIQWKGNERAFLPFYIHNHYNDIATQQNMWNYYHCFTSSASQYNYKRAIYMDGLEEILVSMQRVLFLQVHYYIGHA